MTTILLAAAVLMAEPKDKAAKAKDDPAELLKVFRDEFLHVTPGKGKFPAEFTMGEDGSPDSAAPAHAAPAHKVRFDYDFHIARYEVPQNLWEAVMRTNPSKWKGRRNSVEMLSYDEAVEFCERVTKQLREAKLIEPTQVVRLPSEAEWEYVARAGSSTRYSFGDNEKDLGQYAWFTGNAAGNDPPVGAKKPNPWGLYDAHGYLWEWCSDPWHADYKSAPTDGSAWAKGGDDKQRVARGGSWKDKADKLTSAYRQGLDRKTRDDAVGLRCVVADEKPAKAK
jgi:formylglycine-generating enzyme required for sulfatase activity